MSDVNVPLLRKAVEWAEAEANKPPELCEWMQEHYVTLSPADRDKADNESAADFDELIWAQQEKSPDCGTCFCIAGYVAFITEGNLDDDLAHGIAVEQLGIDQMEAGALFAPMNDIARVRYLAEQIAEQKL